MQEESEIPLVFAPNEHPDAPGVYLLKAADGRILYVGKAKSLRKRLASYFRRPEQLASKTRIMVTKAASIDVLCTTTEKEALLLEASLIKKRQPRYNICLRDDKQYVLFKLDTQTEYPRLVLTRRVICDGALYFGPLPSARAARQTLKAVCRLFPLRRCKETAFRNRVRPCLYYHLGQCLGPCVLEVSKDAYANMVHRVRLFLTGRSKELVAHLQAAMQEHAGRQEFEKAAEMRDLLRGVSQTLEQQAAVLGDGLDRDVLGMVQDESGLGVSVLFVRQGRLLDSRQFCWSGVHPDARPWSENHKARAADGEELQEILDSFLVQFYGPAQFIPERIVLPLTLKNPHVAEILAERRGARVRVDAARGAGERGLLEMAAANAGQALRHKKPDVVGVLAEALGLSRPLARIEAVDVSHLAGRSMVVGLVVFEHGRPLKSAYRKYVFPDLEGSSNDYLALARWAGRRAAAGPPWPDMLLVDGGLGQLSAVSRALEGAGIDPPWPLVGIAKAGRCAGELEDRIFFSGRKNPLPFKSGSSELLFLQNLRDAAHRFAISRQRLSRKKAILNSQLTAIKGVGLKTAQLLWEHYPDVQAMHQATVEDLAALPGLGAKRAAKLHAALRQISTA